MRDIPPYESGVVFLPCADPGRTEAFYHDLLGLPVAQRQGEDVVIFDTGRGYWGFCRYADGRAPLSGPKGACLSLNLESVEAVDAVAAKIPGGRKIAKILIDVATIVFFYMVYRGGKLYAAKAMVIKISTMPKFKMGQVYKIFPIAAILCIIGLGLGKVIYCMNGIYYSNSCLLGFGSTNLLFFHSGRNFFYKVCSFFNFLGNFHK